jgi:DUF2924 family protein
MSHAKNGRLQPDRKAIGVEIARVRELDIGALRTRWHTVFGRRAPAHLPRHLLFRILAYRLQADHLGDLDPESQRLLDRSEGRAARRKPGPTPDRHCAGAGMEWTDAAGDSAREWLCLERQDLSEPVEGCPCDHRYPLERATVLWPAG